jgi:hypothetical protein
MKTLELAFDLLRRRRRGLIMDMRWSGIVPGVFDVRPS